MNQKSLCFLFFLNPCGSNWTTATYMYFNTFQSPHYFLSCYSIAPFNLVRPWQVKGGRLVGHTMQSQTEQFLFFLLPTFHWFVKILNLINWDSPELKLTRDNKMCLERKFDLRVLFEGVRDIIEAIFTFFVLTRCLHQSDFIFPMLVNRIYFFPAVNWFRVNNLLPICIYVNLCIHTVYFCFYNLKKTQRHRFISDAPTRITQAPADLIFFIQSWSRGQRW